MAATDAQVQPRPELGQPTNWAFPDVDERQIGDGLRLHQVEVPGRDLVAVDILFDAPITLEPAGLEGLAMITGQALDEGSSRRDANAFAAALDRQGATMSTSSGTTGIRVMMEVPRDNLGAAFGLLSEAILDPVFPGSEVQRLTQQRADSIRQQYARPESRAGIAVRDVMFDGHPRLSLPNGGTVTSMEAVDRDAASSFHRDHLLTSPARVVIAGDLADVDIPALVGDHLGHFQSTRRKEHDPVDAAASHSPRVVIVDKPGSVQTHLVAVRPGIDRHLDDWAATRIAAFVLGGTLTSRLDTVLREDKGYTYGVRTRMTSFRRGGLTRLLDGSVDTENTAESVALALGIMRGLSDGGVEADEVTSAVDYLAGVRPLTLETPRALSSEVARNLQEGLPGDHTTEELAALRSVTVETVSAAGSTHLDPKVASWIAVGDADAIRAGFDDAGVAEVEIVHDEHQ